MKKLTLTIIIVILAAFISACSVDNMEISENIEAPRNMNLPIEGRYIIEDYKLSAISTMTEEDAKAFLGREAIFNENLVSIGDDYCYEPNYKIKNVEAKDYLIYYYKTNPELLNITDETIQIVSVSGVEQFFNDFIRISEETVIVNIDGVFFFLNKAPDNVETDKMELSSVPQEVTLRAMDLKEKQGLNSGILLGLKSLDLEGDSNIEKWNYRTIFIRSVDRSIVGIQEMENILLPRMTGFWKVEVQREEVDGKVRDNIVAYPLNRGTNVAIKTEGEVLFGAAVEDVDSDETIKNILFLGNDYISIENIHYRNKGQRYLELYPVDNINESTPVKISDIMGETGREALIEGFNKEIVSSIKDGSKGLLNFIPKEESFGLFRRNGLWILKGRVNYIKNGNYMYEDFNIPAIPTQEIIRYDELCIPWKEIKNKRADAIDAFTSPNEDIAIVVTRNEILVYPIEENTIGNEPIGRIELKQGEKIVMAEWAIGRYPQLWEKEFIRGEK